MKTDMSKRSTRNTILDTIKSMHQATVDDLAKVSGVSPVTVRHHLKALLADGSIYSETARRRVGRPVHIYQLTAAGQELFPKKYFALSTRLLEEIKAHFEPEVVELLFKGVVQRIVDDYRDVFEKLPFERRLTFLVDLLGREGFLARWHRQGENYEIVEYSCPLLSIGHQHGEICTLDTLLIESVMGTAVQQESCMLDGEENCRFTISAEAVLSTTIPVSEVQTL